MAPEIQRKKILIIDDELDMRIFLCNLLGKCGYEPIDSGEAAEGIQKAKKEKPDLIIIDMMMPREGGIQFYRQLKEEEDLKEVPVIMMSNLDERTFFLYQKFAGLSRRPGLPQPGAYMEKPLEAEELIKMIRSLTATNGCPMTGEDEEGQAF